MRSKLIIALLLLCLGASAQKYPKTGSKEIKEVVICDTLILNLLKNEIIPELISLDRNSSEYDIYLNVRNWSHSKSFPSDYELVISARKTYGIPDCINNPNCRYRFTELNGYTIFIEFEFEYYYTKLKEPESHRLFNFDNQSNQQRMGHEAQWVYYLIGDVKNPDKVLFRYKDYYNESIVDLSDAIIDDSEFNN